MEKRVFTIHLKVCGMYIYKGYHSSQQISENFIQFILVPRSSRLARRLLLTSTNKTKKRLEKIKLSRADTCYNKIGCYGMMKNHRPAPGSKILNCHQGRIIFVHISECKQMRNLEFTPEWPLEVYIIIATAVPRIQPKYDS